MTASRGSSESTNHTLAPKHYFLGACSVGFLLLAIASFVIATRDAHRLSPRLSTLIEQSSNGHSFMWCQADLRLLNPQEVSTAEKYVLSSPDASSYLIILVLREDYSTSYAKVPLATRAAILCSALSKLRALDDWGQLDADADASFDGIAAEGLLETGKVAITYLRPLLDDRSPARLAGSEESTLSVLYEYRRADFAYRYLCLILGIPPKFHLELEKRDKEIEDVKGELDKLLKGAR